MKKAEHFLYSILITLGIGFGVMTISTTDAQADSRHDHVSAYAFIPGLDGWEIKAGTKKATREAAYLCSKAGKTLSSIRVIGRDVKPRPGYAVLLTAVRFYCSSK